MTNELQQRLDAIAEREAKATPGPWKPRLVNDSDDCGWDAVFPLDREGFEIGCARFVNIHENDEHGAKFVAAASTDIPLLLRLCRAFAKPLTWDGETQLANRGAFGTAQAFDDVMARRAKEVLRNDVR